MKNLEIFRRECTSPSFYAKIISDSFGFCHRERQVNKMNHTMKEIPESQRPYEKCIREGENTLSDSELLAVILRCGTRGMNSLTLANDILSHLEQSPYPGLLGLLHCSVSDLKKIHGIGAVKAVQLKCIGELSKRIASTAARISLDFNSPDSIAAYYMEQLRHQEQEIILPDLSEINLQFRQVRCFSVQFCVTSLYVLGFFVALSLRAKLQSF